MSKVITKDEESALKKPFHPKQISWRVQSTFNNLSNAIVIPYLDPRRKEDRLDSVLGPERWEKEQSIVNEDYKEDGFLILETKIFVWENGKKEGEPVVRCNIGEASDLEDSNLATGIYAQSFKRACASLGVGRYLYYCDAEYVDLEDSYGDDLIRASVWNNGSYATKYFERPSLPDFATPDGWDGNESINTSGHVKTSQDNSQSGSENNSQDDGKAVPEDAKESPSSSSKDFDRDEEIDFGQHQGKKWKEAPDWWIEWVSGPDFDDGGRKEKAKKEKQIRKKELLSQINTLRKKLDVSSEQVKETALSVSNISESEIENSMDVELDVIDDIYDHFTYLVENDEEPEFVNGGNIINMDVSE